MEVSPERIDMMLTDFEVVRNDLKDLQKEQFDECRISATFRGKIEGAVRVLHWFLYVSTSLIAATLVLIWNSLSTLHSLEEKISTIDPVTLKMMEVDVADLKARIKVLENVPVNRNVQSPHR